MPPWCSASPGELSILPETHCGHAGWEPPQSPPASPSVQPLSGSATAALPALKEVPSKPARAEELSYTSVNLFLASGAVAFAV